MRVGNCQRAWAGSEIVADPEIVWESMAALEERLLAGAGPRKDRAILGERPSRVPWPSRPPQTGSFMLELFSRTI